MRATKSIFASLAGLVLLAGCQTGQLPDPNAPDEISSHPDIIRRNLLDYREHLQERALKGEIMPTEVNKRVAERAKEMLVAVKETHITPANAWQYADAYRQAENWERAMEILDESRKNPVDEDRRVNDSIQFARCAAHLGKMTEALAAVRETFTASPQEKAPILPGVLLEVVPEGRGKKHDAELAAVLEEAIAQHNLVEVDVNSDAGRAFFQAKPFHIQNAWALVIKLYSDAGKTEMAREALDRRDKMISRFGNA